MYNLDIVQMEMESLKKLQDKFKKSSLDISDPGASCVISEERCSVWSPLRFHNVLFSAIELFQALSCGMLKILCAAERHKINTHETK